MKIYIAGPEVFLPNAVEVLEAKKSACAKYGFEGVSPFDTDIDQITNDFDCGVNIAAANEKLIESCHIVIANITTFRGLNADPGTIYEIGYARALRKLIFAYTYDTESHAERISRHYYEGEVEPYKDFLRSVEDQTFIDDFSMSENAMIDGGITLSEGSIIVKEIESVDFSNIDGFVSCLELISRTPLTILNNL